MDHIAIMKPSWGLTKKILEGRKTIESRWLTNKSAPWGKVMRGDTIYFKDSGRPVTVAADVEEVEQISDLKPEKVMYLLQIHGKADGIEEREVPKFFKLFKDKRYCVLVFLKKARQVEPFEVDKSGFGSMSAWMTVGSINKVRKTS